MDNNNKNLWVSVVIVVILIAGIVYWSINRSSTSEQNPSTAQTQEVTPTEDTSAGSIHGNASPAALLSYQQALVKYKDARIQLDRACQATPNNVTYKNGTSVMLDNRAPVARIVKVGSNISIKGWGFKIVNIYRSSLPGTWLVDCYTSQNLYSILIQ